MARQLAILGTSVTLPDPASVTDLAARFQEQGGQMAEAETTLQSLARPDAWGQWSGLAADAFGQSIGQLPAQLGDVCAAYEDVASALRQYASQLEPVVNALSSLSYPAEEAEYTLAATERARAAAIASGQDPATITAWNIRVADAAAAVSGLRGQLNRHVAELSALASTCTRQIKAAEPKSAHKSLFGEAASDFMRDVADPVGHGAKAMGKGLIVGGDATWHLVDKTFLSPFTELPGDLVNYVEHPDLHTAGKLLQDIGDVAGVIAVGLVVAGVIVVASVGTGGAADVAIAGAVETAGDVALVAHSEAVVANTGAVVSHEDGASWSDVSNSALSVASDVAGGKIDDTSAKSVSIVFDTGSGLETTAFDEGLKHELSIPEAAPDTPDVTSGLEVSAGSVQGLQGLPVIPVQAAGGAGVLQPAVSVPSPAVVNIQHVTLTPLQGAPAGGASGLEGNM